ncbi:hypothetical protein PIB30_020955 [Stylosanthes scabra]|uniref:Uncharacterized protein n=1 Tax=Stylosanthes scabra TaxID=79078 RepID=A0ABU6R971_9FABA|nr:hypothetical protein [Stylosanthes scabra]
MEVGEGGLGSSSQKPLFARKLQKVVHIVPSQNEGIKKSYHQAMIFENDEGFKHRHELRSSGSPPIEPELFKETYMRKCSNDMMVNGMITLMWPLNVREMGVMSLLVMRIRMLCGDKLCLRHTRPRFKGLANLSPNLFAPPVSKVPLSPPLEIPQALQRMT